MGFFSDVKSDLSAETSGAEQDAVLNAAESLDLDSMLDRLDSTVIGETAEPKETVVTENFFDTEEESAAAAPEPAQETDEAFLSKLSEALGSPEGATPVQEEVPEAPAFAEPAQEPLILDMPEEIPEPVPEEAAAPAEFVLPEETVQAAYTPAENTFAPQEGGFTMDMDLTATTAPATDENAVITGGMTVNGDVQTSGNLELMGKVTGNVRANGKLTISGEINGDSVAAEIYAENARINGEVKSQGSVKVGQSTVIIGNIYANGAVIAGAVKGDIDVHGPVILDTTAIVMGNIKSQSVQINNGAVIEGMCSQVYAEVNPSAFFDNLKG